MNTREYLISKGHSPEAIICNDWDKIDSEFDLEDMLEDYHQTKLKNSDMKNTVEDIQKAISNLKKKVGAKITRHCRGYIIMAQDERGFEGEKNRIIRGDIKGFYTVYDAVKLN